MISNLKKVLLIACVICSVSVHAADKSSAKTPNMHGDWSFGSAATIPVQSGGRVKPFEALARETVLYVTGKTQFSGWNPVDLFYSWTAHPEFWNEQPIIKVSNQDLKRMLMVSIDRSYFSPSELIANPNFQGHIQARDGNKELQKLVEKLSTFQQIASGELWRVIPKAYPTAWSTLAVRNEKEGQELRLAFYALVAFYARDDRESFEGHSALVKKLVQKLYPNWDLSLERKLKAESLFLKIDPFFWSWIIYFLGAVFWIVWIYGGFDGRSDKRSRQLSRVLQIAGALLTAVAFGLHVFGMVFRSIAAGRPPVTNMYESVIWVSFGVIVFAFLIFIFYRQKHAIPVASVLAGLGLLSAQSAPVVLDPSISPLVPVLRDNFWLTTHVLTITLGYAAFALALGTGDIAIYQHLRKDVQKVTLYNLITYRAMQFGVVLLAAGTILGGVWADYSWGRFWGWDPKETWAFIALLCYIAILHARYAGWMKPFAFSAFSVISFLSVMMAWYGVNFVLGAGLHSYGFASGGLEPVAIFVAVHVVYVAAASVVYSTRKRRS